VNIIQGSEAWFQARLGRVTASRVADLVAKTKSGYSTSRANYMAELIVERLTGARVAEGFTSAAMQWGIDNEPDARIAYEFATAAMVTEIGFVGHPSIDAGGASPDGMIGADGLVEIKCPLTATHIETLLGQSTPGRYVTQIQWQLACTGRQWCDFVSFDPRLPEAMQLFVQRLERDDKRIIELETEVAGFLHELATKISKLNSLYGLQDAA
jgi:putative phage-type endonuclease